MLQKNRNILEPVLFMTLQKFGKKLRTHLDLATNLLEGTNHSMIAYNKQRNVCVILLRKTKTDYVANLASTILKDNKKF